jgi:hypothetical protein
MIDMFNLSDPYLNTQVFTAGTTQWQTWTKPDKANMIYIFCIGGAGGGGGGRTSASNSGCGGGGGASSGITVGVYQAILLPDTLYLQVGIGGQGGAPNSLGGAGTISYISYRPDITAINLLLQSSTTTPGGGTAGGSSVPGTGGTVATVWNYTTAINGDLGIITVSPGQAGLSGTGGGGSVTNLTPITIITGGAGGGTNTAGAGGFNGGSITGSGFFNTISSGVINAADTSIHGNSGYNSLYVNNLPDFFTGGAGGGPGTTSGRAGGKGGNGAYGSGGGGGASAYSGSGGAGGKGGDGLIIIACS